jgi:ribonuclease VapC
MMVVDSSVVIAIIFGETGYERFVAAVELSEQNIMSAATYLECAMVVTNRTGARAELDTWIDRFRVEVIAVDLAQARLAADAFARFGRGRHAARLNYGDCFAYALAATRDAPVLYKGTDFNKTDLRSALPPPE